ncbi:uncharacterized protein [Physcomitrium patens]|uniref:F-box domain-containing protein n=3 Tax=Physcomitrium patens TaxID=3218 RepID=A0A7I4FR44_PHYPA|nr:uncharacterized protein LOC112282731 [Physcomitrium patens]XP_024376516.1 uncharacterized protein LOC112282731 [Physcomitrium patens]|eukprot:XP_024376515.1 uncharacterized protein LOC112282731 [Physcomitrella patens]
MKRIFSCCISFDRTTEERDEPNESQGAINLYAVQEPVTNLRRMESQLTGDNPHRALRSVRVCRNFRCSICSGQGLVYSGVRDCRFCCHPGSIQTGFVTEPLDPGVWSKLPLDLLEFIFARLPIDFIVRLRALSKAWKRELSTCSSFTTECAKSQPNLGAIMGFSTDSCWVRVYDTTVIRPPYENPRKWHAFRIKNIPKLYASSMTACDGGLVCIVPLATLQPVLVLNPLTREWRQLPLQRLVKHPGMVQLRVDRDTRMYEVILVGFKGGSGVIGESYDSNINQWSAVASGNVMGPLCEYPRTSHLEYMGWVQVYNGSKNLLRGYRLPKRDPDRIASTRWRVLGYATCMNNFYFLESEIGERFEDGRLPVRFNVSKFEEGNWRVGSHESIRISKPSVNFEFHVDIPEGPKLLVCKSFFMVVFRGYNHNYFVLIFYDLENNKWQKFDLQCTEYSVSRKEMETAFACELRWDARP